MHWRNKVTVSQHMPDLLMRNPPEAPVAYIIDDSQDDRERMEQTLLKEGYNTLSFSDGRDFLDQLDTLEAGYVLLDVRMPGIDGISVVEKLSDYRKKFPVIMVSGQSGIATAVKAMKKGACDFIEKPWQPGDIISTLKQVRENIEIPQPGHHEQHNRKQQLLNKITPRETQVLELLIEGHQNKYIAFELGIAERTVEMHRSRLMKRLEVRSFAELIRIAVKAGIGDELDKQ